MKFRIEWMYGVPKGIETVFLSEEMTAEEVVQIAEDLERTGRVKKIQFEDQFDSSWTLKEVKAYLKEIETEPHNIKVYFDGGYELSSGNAGLGCVIYYKQNGKSYRRRTNAKLDELSSNNEAEYAALYFCLQELEELEVRRQLISFVGDSRIVINRMEGEWPVIEDKLGPWIQRIKEKVKELGLQEAYQLTPRKENAEADKLATQALKGISIASTTELLKE
ncbi:hypothetical protein Plano_0694 [Planococcus sp. PAMC 21323]|uniref:reverse transcriptase-like protein n=1 Tax=Planococcus sp. PAMC 21323 TaxID=1526927 RepID=UPI0005715810|nr:reverse transcriptase-like protein [Planococcus sp. PAMC 21323]AIY04659.1 hypothetical protein Plano_0694 [Planococcus sp. PAMC 21323]